MKAVILVGGQGTRLRPLTCNTPKPMIPLMNQPFIEHMLEQLRDQGIDEVVLAVQYLADHFRKALGDGSRLGLKIHIIEEPQARGTAGAVKNVEYLLDGTTFVFNGDVMTDLDLRAMLDFHHERGSTVMIIGGDPQDRGQESPALLNQDPWCKGNHRSVIHGPPNQCGE